MTRKHLITSIFFVGLLGICELLLLAWAPLSAWAGVHLVAVGGAGAAWAYGRGAPGSWQVAARPPTMASHFRAQSAALRRAKRRGDVLPTALPTYLVIGPSGGGKTTMLTHAGLDLRSTPSDNTPWTGWFVAQEGVFLDTPGSYCDSGAGREARCAFLHLLRRHCGTAGLDGVLVVVRGDAVAQASFSIDALREALADVSRCLGTCPPTYLLLSQGDHTPGFAAAFGDLTPEFRRQPWGFRLTDEERSSGARADTLCDPRIAELSEALRAHATFKLDTQMSAAARAAIFLFPQYFERQQAALLSLLRSLFSSPTFATMPFLRGVYFCSVAPQMSTAPPAQGDPHAPVEAEFESSAALVPSSAAGGLALSVAAAAPAELSPAAPGGYFLQTLFCRLLPEDQGLSRVVHHAGWLGIWQRRRSLLLGAGALLCLTLAQLGALRKNLAMIETLGQTHAALSTGAGRNRPEDLEPLRRQVLSLARHARTRAPLSLRLGLYQGHAVVEKTIEFYVHQLRQDIFLALEQRDMREMEALWQQYEYSDLTPSGDNFAHHARLLKMHLLLTGPRERYEPPRDVAAVAWLSEAVAARWADAQGDGATDAQIAAVMAHVSAYAELVDTRPDLALPRAPQVVSRVRAVLGRKPLAEALVEQLLGEAAARLPALRLRDVVGNAPLPWRAPAEVAAAFTRPGWERVVRPWLQAQRDSSDAWVYTRPQGQAFDPQRAALELRSRYYARYIEAWQSFLDGMTFAKVGDAQAALVALQQLTHGEPLPYRKLFAALAEHTRLASTGGAVDPTAAAGGLLSSVRKKLRFAGRAVASLAAPLQREGRQEYLDAADVESTFAELVGFGAAPAGAAPGDKATLPLDAYHDQLIGLRNALKLYLDDPSDAEPLARTTQSSRTQVQAMLESLPDGGGARPRLQALLEEPLRSLSQGIARGLRSQAGVAWCRNVVQPYAHLARCYPFARDGADAALADVADFFRPQSGTLWSFVQTELGSDLWQRGDHFAFNDRMGGAIRRAYRPELLLYLQSALATSRALFASAEQGAPAVEFEARLLPAADLSQIELELDGQVLPYDPQKAQPWQRSRWPGPKPGGGGRLQVKGRNGMRESLRQEGDWGVFRLLEQGQLRAADGGPQTFTVAWPLASQATPVQLEIRLLRRETPFFGAAGPGRSSLLAPFRAARLQPPASIAYGAPACRAH